MDLFEVIKKRRSVRSFKKEEVSQNKIRKLVESAIWAPSGSNIYAWGIKVVRGKLAEKIKKFSPGLYGDPPVLMVICVDKKIALEEGGEMGREILSFMDVAIAAQNICLQATEIELGTCIVRSFNQKAVQKILGLSEKIVPELIVSVGIPENFPQTPPKKEVEEVVEWIGW